MPDFWKSSGTSAFRSKDLRNIIKPFTYTQSMTVPEFGKFC